MKWDVLDKGFIELQDVMGSDQDIVAAARASYLGDSKGEEADKKLLFYLMEHRHTTPFEMAEIKMRVKAPAMVMAQWVRHRTWSYNSQSARYTEASEHEFYLPTTWRLQDTVNKQGSKGEVSVYDSQLFTSKLLYQIQEGYALYKLAVDRGIAKEQARLFLPGFAFYYTFVAKVDLHNLLHFLRLRMDDHAQWEIRQYAQVIWENIVKEYFPWTAEAFEKTL